MTLRRCSSWPRASRAGQLSAKQLARFVARESTQECDRCWHKPWRCGDTKERAQLVLGQVRPRAAYDERHRHLALEAVWRASHGGLDHIRVPLDELLDLDRAHAA